MHRTRSGIGVQDRADRLAAERRRAPEAAGWLRLLEIALDAAEAPPWTRLEPQLAPARAADAPVLQDAFVAVDQRAARRLVRALLKAASQAGADPSSPAATLRSLGGRRLDPLATLEAAVRQDAEALEAIAEGAGADVSAFAAVADVAAVPLLRGCARAAASRVPGDWSHGYCPACGAWPALVELRGIDRARRVRCGRCSTDWALPVLWCPFCAESDHRKMGALVPESDEQNRRVDGCESCNGYLKSLTTLAPLPAWAIPLEDFATVELDLAAAERGWSRPPGAGHPLAMRVVAADGRLASALGGWA